MKIRIFNGACILLILSWMVCILGVGPQADKAPGLQQLIVLKHHLSLLKRGLQTEQKAIEALENEIQDFQHYPFFQISRIQEQLGYSGAGDLVFDIP